MPALLLIVAFIVVPLAELAVIIEVARAIGLAPTIAVLLLDSIVGGYLLRAQGRAAWQRLVAAMRAGRVPHREALDGGLVVFGGALLLTPGFITDVVGLLLLIPPTRTIVRRALAGLVARRVLIGVVGRGGAPGRGAAWPRPRPEPGREPRPRRHYDVEGSAADMDRSPDDGSTPRLDR